MKKLECKYCDWKRQEGGEQCWERYPVKRRRAFCSREKGHKGEHAVCYDNEAHTVLIWNKKP